MISTATGTTVSVFLALAGGGFAPRAVIGPGYHGFIGDLTGDGKRDILVGNTNHDVLIYPGDGTGSFGAPLDIALSGGDYLGPFAEAADLDHDGDLDLVAGYTDTLGVPGIGARLSLGGGVFGPLVFSPDAGFFALADFDGDGELDGVFSNGYAKGHGDGSFDAPTYFGAAEAFAWTAVGDLDRDGHVDVVNAVYGASAIDNIFQLYRGHGDGTVEPPVPYPTAFDVYWLGVADLNVDGRLDVLMNSYNQSQFEVYLANTDGTFGGNEYAAGTTPLAVALADVTGDGTRDVVAAVNGTPALRLFPGIGNGKLGAATDFATPADVKAVAIGDFNGDGWRDLVCANGSSNSISVFLGAGAGAMGPRADYPMPGPGTRVAVGDLNGDGRDDVVAIAGGNLAAWLADPTGVLGARVDKALLTTGVNLTVAKVNGDAFSDVLVASNCWIAHFPGDGTGTLGSRVDVASSCVDLEFSGPLVAGFGDTNGDGNLDVLLANQPNLYVWLGNGSGGFTGLPRQTGSRQNYSVAFGDVDEDGKLDLVTAGPKSGCARVRIGDGTGKFAPLSVAFGGGAWPVDAQLADMDGDGHIDIVTANQGSNTVSVLLNRSPGLVAVGPSLPGPAARALALSRVGPVPARGDLSVAFVLPVQGHVAIELLDVAGRRVRRVDLGELPPGEHAVNFPRGVDLGAGVYWLRLAQGANAASAKVVFVD